MKGKILMIAYYFPPVGGGGVQRTSKFVKYLKEFGWEPIVLTVKEEIYRKTGRQLDLSMFEDIPKGTHVARTYCADLGNISKRVKKKTKSNSPITFIKSLINKVAGLLINPDSQMFWIPSATLVGLGLIKKYKIDVIYSTGNPWSDHIIGAILRKLTRVPWIADYRDPWNLNPYITLSSKIRKNIQMFLEAKVIELANKVVFTTDRMRMDYERVFGNGKFLTILNGFDPDDFQSVNPKKFPKFTLLYAGNMQPYRGPYYFVCALSNWLKRNPKAREEIMVNILGRSDQEAKAIIDSKDLQNLVNFYGYQPHKKSISYLMGTNVALSIVDEGGESIIPGKIYEYFASGKPILALVPSSGSAADILRKEGRGEYIADPRDLEAIQEHLSSLYNKYKRECLPRYPVDDLDNHTRRKATEKLSKLFDKLIYLK